MPFFGVFPLVFLIVLIGGGVWLARKFGGPQAAPPPPAASALDILNARYARGEIDRDAYVQARADVGAPPTSGAAV